jgi:hypothetical protein
MESVRGPESSFMGSWETSVIASSYDFAKTDIFPFRSGRGKKRFLVRQSLDNPDSGELIVFSQLHNNQGGRCHAESWTRVTRIFLL